MGLEELVKSEVFEVNPEFLEASVKALSARSLRDSHEFLGLSGLCNGFLYGSIARGDNVMPDVDSIKLKGLSPLDAFYGNDVDFVAFNPYGVFRLFEHFMKLDVRLHVYYYRPKDVEAIAPFLDKHVEAIPGTFNIIPHGESAYQVVSNVKVRTGIKKGNKGRFFDNAAFRNVEVARWMDELKFFNYSGIKDVELGLFIVQFLSATHDAGCAGLIKNVRARLEGIDLSNVLIANARTLYSPLAYECVKNEVLDRPRYLYDGLLKLLRTVYIRENGVKTCCQNLDAYKLFSLLSGSLEKRGINIPELTGLLRYAVDLKLASADPKNKDLVLKAGSLLFDRYQKACYRIDNAYFKN